MLQLFYICQVLYQNSYSYNWANGDDGVEGMVKKAGWTKITKYEDLQPGDVGFSYNTENGRIWHTMIYAGDNYWYTWGDIYNKNNGLIKAPYYKGVFAVAYRIPTASAN